MLCCTSGGAAARGRGRSLVKALSIVSCAEVSRLCHEDRLHEALGCVEQQKTTSLPRDTIYDLLQVCTRRKDLLAARQVESLMIQGGLDTISVLADHLIRLFTICGSLLDADQAFYKVVKPTVYTWNSIITAHVKLGRVEKALHLFEDMQLNGISPDKVTFLYVLKACGTVKAIDHGRLAHFQLLISDPELLPGVGNMLVDMYAKCGRIEEGRKVFEKLGNCDVISWGALMTGYAQEGHNYDVLENFKQMYRHSVKPNKVVFLSVLKSCSGIPDISKGFLTHYLILENEVSMDMAMASAIVDMYAKCGGLVEARQVFDALPCKDVKAWGAIMSGYAAHGSCGMVERCFQDMKALGVKPDNAIFTNILACYSHAGLLLQGYAHFHSMPVDYGITPTREQYNCMVDLLGRAGHLREAKSLLDSAPNKANLVGWLSLLTNCKTYNNPSIGRLCFTKVMELEPTEARGYMLMSNIYANAGMWHEVDKLQEQRKKACAWKKPGISTIEVDHKLYDFFVGAKSNPQTDLVYGRLDVLRRFIKGEGYVPQLEVVVELVTEVEQRRSFDEKTTFACRRQCSGKENHSAMLATHTATFLSSIKKP